MEKGWGDSGHREQYPDWENWILTQRQEFRAFRGLWRPGANVPNICSSPRTSDSLLLDPFPLVTPPDLPMSPLFSP